MSRMTIERLNELREQDGQKPLKSWKASKAKLAEAITKLEDKLGDQAAESVEEVAKPAKKSARKLKAPKSTFSLVDVARELKANPKVLRAKFRRHFPDHEGPWVFPSDDRDEIVAIAKG